MDSAANRAYLATHFLAPAALAERAGIDRARLQALVDGGLVPQPSYTVIGDRLVSAAFGELACPGLEPGAYFHRGMHVWVDAALRADASLATSVAAQAALRDDFTHAATDALMRLADDGLCAPDCFDARDRVDPDAVRQRIKSHWQTHLAGIFGVCVRQPDAIAQIVLKETLQSLLAQATDNGARTDYAPDEAVRLRGLSARYADACAPFAPVEYPRSSRRRFVEDLATRLAESMPASG
jgi:hypothetical protein